MTPLGPSPAAPRLQIRRRPARSYPTPPAPRLFSFACLILPVSIFSRLILILVLVLRLSLTLTSSSIQSAFRPTRLAATRRSTSPTSVRVTQHTATHRNATHRNAMPSSNQGPRHVGQWLYLRPECVAEYKKCHAAVWPKVLEQIRDSNVRDCTSTLSHTLIHPLRLPPSPPSLSAPFLYVCPANTAQTPYSSPCTRAQRSSRASNTSAPLSTRTWRAWPPTPS